MNKNSNSYIIIYSTVMVVVVAALLAVASLSLQGRQNANILNEKKQAILASLGAGDRNYDEYITAYAVDANGQRIEGIGGNEVIQMLFDLDTAVKGGTYPVFESSDHRYVLPVSGKGLWGPIWGYVALDGDMNTLAGVVFDHAGETPGLGAEIATPKFQAEFPGKTIFEGSEFVSVKLRKGGATEANIAHEVDAISGGTKTSDGVTAMLYNSVNNYLPFFAARREAAAVSAQAQPAEEQAPVTEVSNE